MSTPRVKSSLSVSIALRRGDMMGKPGMVLRKGDPDAGGILLVLRGREGCSVVSRVTGSDGEPTWMRATGEGPVDQEAADAYVERRVKSDPDLWVLEFETGDLAVPFDAKTL